MSFETLSSLPVGSIVRLRVYSCFKDFGYFYAFPLRGETFFPRVCVQSRCKFPSEGSLIIARKRLDGCFVLLSSSVIN